MINKKILGLIGLSARARKISYGADSVENDIKRKKVYLVIIANDSSLRTKDKFKKTSDENSQETQDEFKKIAEKYKIPIIIEGDIEELSKAIGKSNKAILGIEDINLSNEIQKMYNGGEIIG